MPKTLDAQIYFIPKSLKGTITKETDLDQIASIPLSVSINPQNYPDELETVQLVLKDTPSGEDENIDIKSFSLTKDTYDPQNADLTYPIVLKSYAADITTIAESKQLCSRVHSTNKMVGVNETDFSVRLTIDILARGRRKKQKSKDTYFFLYDYEISGFYNFYEIMKHNGEDMKILNKINFTTEVIDDIPDTYFIFYPDEVKKIVGENKFVISYPFDEIKLSSKKFASEGLKCSQRICEMNNPNEESDVEQKIVEETTSNEITTEENVVEEKTVSATIIEMVNKTNPGVEERKPENVYTENIVEAPTPENKKDGFFSKVLKFFGI